MNCHDAVVERVRVSKIGHTDIEGDVGGRVASRMAEHGVEVTGDLTGVETLFLVPVRERPDRAAVHAAVVDSAVAAGVRHIVYLSFLNTSPTATFTLSRDHYATEQHIRGSGVAFTFLRGSAFHEVAHYLLGPDDVIRGPGGSGRVAFVGKEDVVDVAVTVLLAPSAHADVTYDLTGPEALSLRELAELFARTSGRPVTYVEETVEAAYESRAGFGAPQWLLDAWVSTYLQIANGELDLVTTDVQRLLDRIPRSLEAYLTEHPEVLAKHT
jgi:NAD(P)H dehydrogenase (quinone)